MYKILQTNMLSYKHKLCHFILSIKQNNMHKKKHACIPFSLLLIRWMGFAASSLSPDLVSSHCFLAFVLHISTWPRSPYLCLHIIFLKCNRVSYQKRKKKNQCSLYLYLMKIHLTNISTKQSLSICVPLSHSIHKS